VQEEKRVQTAVRPSELADEAECTEWAVEGRSAAEWTEQVEGRKEADWPLAECSAATATDCQSPGPAAVQLSAAAAIAAAACSRRMRRSDPVPSRELARSEEACVERSLGRERRTHGKAVREWRARPSAASVASVSARLVRTSWPWWWKRLPLECECECEQRAVDASLDPPASG
jgi:hypothetical protein